MSKQGKRRHLSPKAPKIGGPKTGPKKDQLTFGFKPHENAAEAMDRFIPKVGK
jgi:hypothetical protein